MLLGAKPGHCGQKFLPVVRVNLCQYVFASNRGGLRYAENPDTLCRSDDNVRRGIPLICEHPPRLGRETKPFLDLSKRFFRSLPFFNIRARAVPPHNPPLAVAQRQSTYQEPPKESATSSHPRRCSVRYTCG